MTIGDFLNRLESVKTQGDGWIARCPAHDDRKPSLSIKEGDDGRILLKCFAGCEVANVASVLSLQVSDLFITPKAKPPSKTKRQIEATYDYRDENGELLFQTVRFNPKDFSQRRSNGNGVWIWNLKGVSRVLYRLPELLASDPEATVFLPEGEKHVDRLRAGGLVATCNPMGAGKWRNEYCDRLRGRKVVILEDNDKPGRDHARDEAKSLHGAASSVRVLQFLGLPEKGDVLDWLSQGGTIDTLKVMAEAAPEWTPDASSYQSQQSQSEPTIREVCLSDIQIKPVPWLWKRRIARGTLTIVEGIEGEGKSTVLCAIGAAVTCGEGLEDMVFEDGAKNVLWLSAEDSPEHVLKPRLLAAGADESRVFVVGEAFTFDDKGVVLVREMAERREPALIVIDPIFAYAKGDPSKGADARAVTNQLKQIAEDLDSAIVLVRHVGKSKGLGDPRAAGLYSIEWRAAARSVLLCGSDPDSPQIKAMTQSKNNLSPFAESIGYTLEEYPPGSEVSRALWTGVSQLTAKRILATMADEDEKAERANATEFLQELLKAGEQKATEVQSAARKNSISERTLNRVKARLGVKSRSEGFGKDKIWYWLLPDGEEKPPVEETEKPAESHAVEAPKQDAFRLPAEGGGNLKGSDGNQSTSGEKISLDCHVAINVGVESPLTMPSGNLRESFSDNSNGSNGLPLDCHVEPVGNLSAAPSNRKRVTI